ncbi:MAG: hypothetical protein JNK00_10680 [Flavipsychrobacter sp.]|nr:hypothetical protein [Flavipsychrobacter sp.]
MITYLKGKLSTGWHFMRVLRLVFAVIFAVQAIAMRDYLVGLMSVFFFYQGITNTGCCGDSCAPVYDQSHRKVPTDDISFEEVK